MYQSKDNHYGGWASSLCEDVLHYAAVSERQFALRHGIQSCHRRRYFRYLTKRRRHVWASRVFFDGC